MDTSPAVLPSPLRLLVDANVPDAHAAFGPLGSVRVLPGREITRAALSDVDVLVVRSVTPVDRALLEGTPVRFVGTATAGLDHVDQVALAEGGVAFASAPGSNAASVVDYVLASLLAVAADRGETLAGRTLGVVGVGEVGGRLARRARALGLRVLACDPPRAAAGVGPPDLVSLADLLRQSDVVSLHTPLTTPAESPSPTLDLIDEAAVVQMRPDAWLVNAARGGVVTAGAARALAESRPVVLDVWPAEPEPDPALVEAVALGTPHVAGYALDAKRRGTAMIAAALWTWAGLGPSPDLPDDAPQPVAQAPDPALAPTAWLDALARQATDVRADDARFRAALAGTTGDVRAAAFADLRKTYPARREMSRFRVRGNVPQPLRQAVADGLGMSLG
ncbi:4-phosphoerythronate dehydrogenase [Rubrivirga sp.]|uniref:4-phosphoerythronate dehydrogenase n=1 Tax=Rubrivirga sp. TaxID=1885344 RepID=UPI003B51856B